MPSHVKYPKRRREIAHRLLFYLSQRTSPKHPDWRNATIEIRDQNPGIAVVVHKDDGMVVYHDAKPLAYFHFRQRHILVHAARGFLLWSKENRPFSKPHAGSWPLMWKCGDKAELDAFLRIVRAQPVTVSRLNTAENSRYISQEVRELVLERDEGCCRAVVAGQRCRSMSNLHFDHILPFSRGGDNLAENIQILCRLHNLQKGSTQRV